MCVSIPSKIVILSLCNLTIHTFLLFQILTTLVSGLSIPVTCKIRILPDVSISVFIRLFLIYLYHLH